jgi:hypothetical protein
MCYQKNSKAFAPPPSGALPVRRVSSESASGVPHRRDRGIDSSIPKQTRTEDRSSVADSRDRPGTSGLWVSQDPGAAEARGLRQRHGIHFSNDGPVGVSCGGAHRLFAAREADRQRLCGIVQRDAADGVPGCPLVRFTRRSERDHRSLAEGIQRESSSQGSRREDAP